MPFLSQFIFAVLPIYAETKLILLGTGTPNADPKRSGPATAIVVNGSAYVVDLGPGVVRRATAAGITPDKLKVAFLTHLHSDHTAGMADFYLSPAVLDRHAPLQLIGPKGTKAMAKHIETAYREDVDVRVRLLERGDPAAYRIDVREIKAGIVYRDANVTVTAIPVPHAGWKHSYAYQFETPDKRIVISGDTTYHEPLAKACNGCDILVHEVYSELGLTKRSPQWQKYHRNAHTSGPDVGRLATLAQPKLLVLTHLLLWSANEAQLEKELRQTWSGPLAIGNDLNVF